MFSSTKTVWIIPTLNVVSIVREKNVIFLNIIYIYCILILKLYIVKILTVSSDRRNHNKKPEKKALPKQTKKLNAADFVMMSPLRGCRQHKSSYIHFYKINF